jgi:hypothetical protein
MEANEYPYWLPNDRFVQYQALRGQEADLRKRAEAMLESADKLGELAMGILDEFPLPESQ